MISRLLSAALATGVFVPMAARSQRSGRRFRIGGFSSTSPEGLAPFHREFDKGLEELGHVDGGKAVFEFRWLRGTPDQLPSLAAELVRWPADVIVVGVNTSIAVAQRATSTIPIVMVLASDPVGSGFVQSLARPGGNITGLSFHASDEMHGKLLQTLKEIVPGLATVGLLTEPSGYDADRAAHESAARRLGLRLEVEEIRGNDGIGDAFASMVRRRVDGFTIIGGSLIYSGRQQIADLALQHRVPGIHFLHDYARAGLLASYGPSLFDMYRRSAGYVDKIYKGAKPADLPVEQPSKFELVINLKTAKALGIAMPKALLLRADEVIE